MNYIVRIILSIFISFAIAMVISPLIIKWGRKLKLQQTILHYVEKHKTKSGTPTMGGLIFIFSTLITVFIMAPKYSKMGKYAVLVMFAYGVLGFLDDFIKVKFKQNLGLKPYQKIIGQIGIGIIVTLYCYFNPLIGTSINIPFSDYTFDLKWWFIPFTLFIYIAITNSVNLTDGLDGLAGNTTLVFMLFFTIIIVLTIDELEYYGDYLLSQEMQSLTVMSGALIGGLLAFLWFNNNPASIFMGDTGSLSLGGAIASLSIFSKNPIIIAIIGIIYIVSSISVIIQVLYFKITHGKRVFMMAPYHHHLEYKGFKETKIVSFYTIITCIFGLLGILSMLGRLI